MMLSNEERRILHNEDWSLREAIATVMRGAFDMHVHAGPDALAPRRCDALEVALAARDAGALATLIRKLVPEIFAIGALTLDRHVGGLNPEAVETEAKFGSRVIWMPTHDAANERRARGHREGGISVLDESGHLVASVDPILAVAAQYDLVIGTGHLSRSEVFALVLEGIRRGVKMVVTHPLTRSVGTLLSIEDQRELVRQGAFIEHCFVATLPNHDQIPLHDLVTAIRAVGPERCIVSSDLGQYHNPPPVEGFRWAIATLLRNGFSKDEVVTLVKRNPEILLGLS
jgi:hypothetical protein